MPMYRQLAAVTTLSCLHLGCVHHQIHRRVRRPPLRVQVQTHVIEIVPSGWSPALSWQRGQLAATASPSDIEEAAVTPSPATKAAFDELVTATVRAALVDQVVEAGSRTGTRFVRSSRPAPKRLDQLPAIRDAPPDRAVYVVSVDGLKLVGPSEPGALLFFGVSMGARALVSPQADELPVADPGLSALMSINTASAVAAADQPATRANADPYYVTAAEWDPLPRTLEDWLADRGHALRVALEQLTERGSGRLATEFAVTGGTWRSRTCGPQPSSPGHGRLDVTRGDGPLRWDPWAPAEAAAARAGVEYDVRVFLLEGGRATTVASVFGLVTTHADLPPLDPGAVYAWTVRGRLTFPDGRKLSSPWWSEVPTSTNEKAALDHGMAATSCLLPLDPWRAQRFQARGETAAGPPPATGPAPPAGRVELDPLGPLPPLERRAGLRRIEVASLRSVIPMAEYQSGELNLSGLVETGTGPNLGYGIVGGAGAGAWMSLSCLVFAPLCAAVLVPAGAVVGLTVEGVRGAISAAAVARGRYPGSEPWTRAARGLRDALADGAIQERLVLAVGAAVPRAGDAASSGASPTPEARLEVAIVRATFVGGQDTDPGMALELTVGARLVMADGSEGYRTARLTFPTPIRGSLWLRDDGALLRGALGETLARSGPEVIDAILRSPDKAARPPSPSSTRAEDPPSPFP